MVNYFFFVAEEVREIMAQLGIRKFDDLIGRADLLDTKKGIEHWKAQGPRLLAHLLPAEDAGRGARAATCEEQDHGLEKALDHRLIELAQPALERGEKVQFIEMPIRNINRTVGTMLSGEIAKRYGHEGLPDDTIHIQLRRHRPGRASAPSSRKGITLDLIGDTNDYSGKGLSGGRIVVQPSHQVPRRADREHHHRQHRAVRRDRGRGVLPRRRRRALRGAQLGRARRSSKAPATTAANT